MISRNFDQTKPFNFFIGHDTMIIESRYNYV